MELDKPTYLPGHKLEDGTLYVGVINDGKKIYHISIEPTSESDKMTWEEAVETQGLPTARELSLISANAYVLKLNTDSDYYWSSTEYNSSYAWSQRFNDGYQFNYSFKSSNYRVRCVRRHLILQSFDYLKPELESLKKRIKEIEDLVK